MSIYFLAREPFKTERVRSTPSPPIKSFPIKSPRVKLSGRLPIKLYEHDNYHPPLRIKSLLESNPLKSKLFIGGLGVVVYEYVRRHTRTDRPSHAVYLH